MLHVIIPKREYYNEATNTFEYVPKTELTLEHSLVSVSKWEAKYHKPFLESGPKNREEEIGYIKCMTITQNVSDEVFNYIPDDVYKQINDYINDPMTASYVDDITEDSKKKPSEKVTSELIYYWMVALQIPPEYEKWHLNRLLMLIRICNKKNAPVKKMNKNQLMARNKALNDARRAKLHTKG